MTYEDILTTVNPEEIWKKLQQVKMESELESQEAQEILVSKEILL